MPEKCGIDDYGNLYLVGRKGECVYPPKDCWSKLDLLYHIAALDAQIAAAIKALRKIDVDEESDIACYRDEAIELLKGATNGND